MTQSPRVDPQEVVYDIINHLSFIEDRTIYVGNGTRYEVSSYEAYELSIGTKIGRNGPYYSCPMCPVVSFFLLLLSFFSSPNLSGRRLDVYIAYFYTWCSPSANLECRSEVCCTRLAGNAGRS